MRIRLLIIAIATLSGLYLFVNSAAAAGTGSIRFEVVNAATGEPLPAELAEISGQSELSHFPAPVRVIEGLSAGEHTFFALYGRYGNDASGPIFDTNDKWGEMVVVTIAADIETLVRIEMTPPSRIRFRAVSETDGTIVAPLSVAAYPRTVFNPPGVEELVIDEGNGWYSVLVHASPIEPIIDLKGPSIFRNHTVAPVPSGTVTTLVEPLTVPVLPTISGQVLDPDGIPVQGSLVQLSPNGSGWDLSQSPNDTTDANGRFEITTNHAVYNVAAFPPDNRDGLAAGGIGGPGLRGSWWPTGDRHPTVEIVLPQGQWLPGDQPRQRPTEASPVTGFIAAPAQGAGINIVPTTNVAPTGWTSSGYIIESWNVNTPVIFDIHESLAPPTGSVPTLARFGADPLTCTLQADCSVHRSRGPVSDQLVAWPNGTTNSWSLLYGPGEPALFLDPPLVSARAFGAGGLQVAISTSDGCEAGLTIAPTFNQITSAPTNAPGLITFFAPAAGPKSLQLNAGNANAILVIDVQGPDLPEFSTIHDTAFGGLVPATCTPPTTTTTTTTTTTEPTAPASTSTTVPVSPTTAASADLGNVPFGYAVVTEVGDVFVFGDLDHAGNASAASAAAIVLHPSGDGYWIVTDTGRVATFGAAEHFGDLRDFVLAGRVIDAAATPSGDGYYLVGADGGLFSFGDAMFRGSVPQVLPGVTLNSPIVGLTTDPDGSGYWFVAGDGGVFGFDAPFRGSIPGVLPPGASLAAPINGMVPYGNGYLLVAGDGGVFVFSNLAFLGSLGDVELTDRVVSVGAV